MTTERDLIQRLAEELDTWLMAHHHGGVPPEIQHATTLVVEARALLSQPEPEGPTDEEILNLSEEHCVSYTRPGGDVIYPYKDGTDMRDDVLSFARALIAADRARWGRPTTATETP